MINIIRTSKDFEKHFLYKFEHQCSSSVYYFYFVNMVRQIPVSFDMFYESNFSTAILGNW